MSFPVKYKLLGENKYIEEEHRTTWIEAPSPSALQFHVTSEEGGGGGYPRP